MLISVQSNKPYHKGRGERANWPYWLAVRTLVIERTIVIRAIVFDLGGVVFTDGTTRFHDYLVKTYHLDPRQTRELLDDGELGSLYREGKITRNQYWQGVLQVLQINEGADTLERRWLDGYELNTGTRDIMLELSRKYRVYFLSDNVWERSEQLNRKYNYLSWLHGGLFSYQVGVRKPNPEIYRMILRKADAQPQEVVFIDDKPSALEPAMEMGMTTILFKSPETLREKLSALGIL
jgi:FMN phosphatase YigB (HAD superfamily)